MIPTEKSRFFVEQSSKPFFFRLSGTFAIFCPALSYRGGFQASSADSLCANWLGDEAGHR